VITIYELNTFSPWLLMLIKLPYEVYLLEDREWPKTGSEAP
jgi:hypothetical protein